MSESAVDRHRHDELGVAIRVAIRVAIMAATEIRHATLVKLVTNAGHAVVDSNEADVLLCDNDAAGIDKPSTLPSVVLGASARARESAGNLLATASAAQIDAALRAVAVGLRVNSAHELHTDAFDELPERASGVLLTPRELQILIAISDGLSNKAIARHLSISLHTVKFHVESLFRKLSVRTRAEAVARGLEHRRRELVEM